MLLALGQPLFNEGTSLLHKSQHFATRMVRHAAFPSLLDHSHTKLPPAIPVSPEQAHTLEEFSRGCMQVDLAYTTLYFQCLKLFLSMLLHTVSSHQPLLHPGQACASCGTHCLSQQRDSQLHLLAFFLALFILHVNGKGG